MPNDRAPDKESYEYELTLVAARVAKRIQDDILDKFHLERDELSDILEGRKLVVDVVCIDTDQQNAPD